MPAKALRRRSMYTPKPSDTQARAGALAGGIGAAVAVVGQALGVGLRTV